MITQRNHYLISRRSKFSIAVPEYSAETLFLSFDILMSEQKGRAESMDPLCCQVGDVWEAFMILPFFQKLSLGNLLLQRT